VDAVVLGRFQIATEGSQALRLPLASVDRQAHAHAVSTDIRDEHGLAWRPFSVVLEELKPPAADLVVTRGEIETFLYDGKGAFLPGAVHKGQTLPSSCAIFKVAHIARSHSLLNRVDVEAQARGPE
jgi:hypothetical protein